MNKKSYTTSAPEKLISSKSTKVSTPPAQDNSGSRGIIFPGMYKDTPVLKDTEDRIDLKKVDPKNKNNTVYSDLKNMIIELADAQDKEGDEVLANFNDFLIKKIAQVEDVDYSHSLNLIIKMLNDSDIIQKDIKIKNIIKLYNRIISLYYNKFGLDGAKLKAYQAAKEEVEKYVRTDF